jgi:hypothetical protein
MNESRPLPQDCPGKILSWRFLLTVLFLGCASHVLAESTRVALVVGNSKYGGELELKNPGNDADAVGAALTKLNFKVIVNRDLDIDGMDTALREFTELMDKDCLALFFFAGHGIQAKGVNYLIPLGANVQAEHELQREALSANTVLDTMSDGRAAVKVLVLDCCRDNPLGRSWRSRSSSQVGLAAMPGQNGTVIAYSTADNSVAEDGSGQNSPYTEEFVKALGVRPPSGMKLMDVFGTTAEYVKRKVGQTPFLYADASLMKYKLLAGDGSVPVEDESGKLMELEQRLSLEMRNTLSELNKVQDQRLQELIQSRPQAPPGSAMPPSQPDPAQVEMANKLAEMMKRNEELMAKLEKMNSASDGPSAPPGTTSPSFQRNAGATSVVQQVANFLDWWETAWEHKDLGSYASFYHADFQGRNYSSRSGWKTMSRSSWLDDKENKFGRTGSITVAISGMEVEDNGDWVKVSFTQVYSSGSYSDRGLKTMILQKTGGGNFLILQEDFQP